MTSLEAYERGKEIAKDMQDGIRDAKKFMEFFSTDNINWDAVNEWFRKFSDPSVGK